MTDHSITADARAPTGAGMPLPTPAIPWDRADATTAAYQEREQAEAARYLKVPDADVVAVDAGMRAPVQAIVGRYNGRREALLNDRDLLPEAKARFQVELERERDRDLALTVERQEARLGEAERRARSWQPPPPDPADLRVANDLIAQRDQLGPKYFGALLGHVLADPVNTGAVRVALPFLKDAYDNPSHRLYADPDLHRLLQLAGRLERDRKGLITDGRLSEITRRRVALDQIRRDPAFALRTLVSDGQGGPDAPMLG